MAVSGSFITENGTAIALGSALGNGNQGTTHTSGITNFDWKNVDDYATAYSASPITAGNNSFDKYIAGIFTGSFNLVSGVLWNHTYNSNAVQMGAGLTIKAYVSGSGLYRTPATTTYASLIWDLTSTGDISTGVNVRVGGGRPGATGKGTSTVSNPGFSEYIVTQLISSSSANPGDFICGNSVWTLQWTEN
jgi:hypothetical protein